MAAKAVLEEVGTEEETADPEDASWRQYLDEMEDEVDEEEEEDDTTLAARTAPEEDSGEDSDADAVVDSDRQKRDMEILLKPVKQPQASKAVDVGTGVVDKEDADDTKSDAIGTQEAEEGAELDRGASRATTPTNDADEGDKGTKEPVALASKKAKGGIMSRMFRGSNKREAVEALGGGTSMLKENIDDHDDKWYNNHLTRLGRDGVSCTKIGTNGKPYDRRVHVDARNLQIEIRGGRTGCAGVMLDDLVDLRKGFGSPEFEQFAIRIRKDCQPADLMDRALVLETPHRTFSLLFASALACTTVGHSVLFLLRSKNRGVMASGPQSKGPAASGKGVKSGSGTVNYPNRSSYTGQFQNYMRHGSGTLTLSDGTTYESEWRNDERHGRGKEKCPDGTVFAGNYVKGMRHGSGVMTWPEGSRYSGHFERGRANGEGELLRTDGSVYKGHFSEDCMSGEGRMQWRDGVEYTGQFVANRREGHGTMHWTTGRWASFKGAWKDGMQHGRGTLTDHSGGEFKGVFNAGKLERWEDQ